MSHPKLLSKFITAGSGNYIVPAGVKKILVAQIGGGGSGAGSYNGSGTSGTSGASGVADVYELSVVAGQSIPWTVGAKGERSSSGSWATGKDGGNTSFGNVISLGGKGGIWASSDSASGALGGQGSCPARYGLYLSNPLYGGRVFGYEFNFTNPNSLNVDIIPMLISKGIKEIPFCCAAGTFVSGFSNYGNPTNVLPNGNLASCYLGGKINAINDGTDPGCGGAHYPSTSSNNTGAVGADGGIFIYDYTYM